MTNFQLEIAWHEHYLENEHNFSKWNLDAIEKEFYTDKLIELGLTDNEVDTRLTEMGY